MMKLANILALTLVITPCILSNIVLSASQEEINSAIAEKLVKYDAIKEAIVKNNTITVSVADMSKAGLESSLRAIAACLIYGYMSTNTDTATNYLIYLEAKMIEGKYHKVGQSAVYSAEIENATKDSGSIEAEHALGDKMIERLSKS